MNNNQQKLSEKVYLDSLVAQPVKLVFTDGKVMRAVHVAHDRYQLFVKTNGTVYMVFKHALRYLYPAGDNDE